MASLKAIGVIIALALIWCLRPFVKIRFGSLFVSRLGHLAGNTECYLCERDAGINRPKRVFDIWTPVGEPANAYLLKMYSRILPISKFAGVMSQIASRWEWWQEHTFSDAQWGRDIHNLMEKSAPHLKFTRAEEKHGEQELRALGIPEGAKWVCIIARNSEYLRGIQPALDYSYHSFRDSDINNYREAALELMERGYYVVRMGTYCAPMRLAAPKFIDYAVNGKRSEFMDIYLGANCEFCISNGTGFDGIPMIFRRPICFVNEAPFEFLSTWMAGSLAIWKHHEKDGKRMTPAEIVASGAGLFSKASEYADAGITLIENTPEEIKDAALEMDLLCCIGGEHQLETNQDSENQNLFWKSYPRSMSPHNGVPLHGEIRLRIGSQFLRQYETAAL